MACDISLCVPTPSIGARDWPGRREEPKAGSILHHHLYKGRRGEVCSRLDQLGSRRDRKLHRRPPNSKSCCLPGKALGLGYWNRFTCDLKDRLAAFEPSFGRSSVT